MKEAIAQKESILIVDDDDSARGTLALIFGKSGYEVETAGTGQEALDKARGKLFNAALLDIRMPDIGGVDLIAPLKRIHPDTVIIMVTGHASLETAVQAQNEGASAYITKPFNVDEVLARVRDTLEKQRLITENRRLLKEVQQELAERKRAEEALKRAKDELETRVKERTAELEKLNEYLTREVATRWQAEEALQASEQNFRNSMDSSSLGIRIINSEGKVLYTNQAILDIYGYNSVEDMRAVTAKQLCTPESYAEHLERIKRRELGEPVPPNYEISIVRKDGEIRHLAVSRKEVIWDGETQFQALYQDITERKRAEEQLRALSHRLVEIQEEERHTIARELHDQFGQSLTILKLLLTRAIRSPAENVRDILAEAPAIINDLITRVRELSLDLWPSILDDLGLLPALLWHFERYTAQTQVRIDFKHSGLHRHFSREVGTAAYRIVQEALINIVRHAGTDKVTVRARANDNILSIRIEDKGFGFNQAALPVGTSSGLSGMGERARLLGGKVTIKSAPGSGTRLIAELPLSGQLKQRKAKGQV